MSSCSQGYKLWSQTSTKCRDLAYTAEPPPLKNCKSGYKIGKENLFRTSIAGANFCISQLPEGLGILIMVLGWC